MPQHVRTVSDYWLWIEEITERSTPGNALIVQPIGDEGDPTGIRVPRQELQFPGGARLAVTFNVDSDLVMTAYNFQFMEADGSMIWRKDKQPGHGPLEHIHRPPDVISPYEEVDLQEVVGEAWDFVERGARP